MSLYDDVLTDFNNPIGSASNGNSNNSNTTNTDGLTASSKTSNDIANWNSNSLKLLQYQVEAAKKRQQLNLQASLHIKREKQTSASSIAPVIDLSDKRKSLPIIIKKDIATNNDSNASFNQVPPSVPSLQPTNLSSNELRFNSITGKIEKEDSSIFSGVYEEYDPMRPNDYEKLILEMSRDANKKNGTTENGKRDSTDKRHRDRKRSNSNENRRDGKRRSRSRDRDRDRKRDRTDKNRRHTSSSSSGDQNDANDDENRRNKRKHNNDDDHASHISGSGKRTAFQPPSSPIEDNKKTITNQQITDDVVSKQPAKNLSAGLLKAEKMMAKMGYKEGDGLGRNKQGMSIALQVEKTGKRSGRIIHEKDVETNAVNLSQIENKEPIATAVTLMAPAAPAASVSVGISNEVMKNMSKVILLRNMVSSGDVDDDLEAETKEECQKYGEVNKVIIFEIPNKPVEEAVRIFVEFKTLPSAIKALTDLDKRFFGGRSVRATFYDLDKFKRLELADEN